MKTVRRRLIKVVLGLALAAALTLAVLLFWPAPGSRPSMRCDPQPRGCELVQGRVVYALSKDRNDPSRPLHLVLAARDSLSWPGFSVIKIPVEMRPTKAPAPGTWVQAVGVPHRGSNGQQNLTPDNLWIAP
jgi:hypothetical protein